jgi:methyl-accepting chemotaxis protein
MKMLNTQNKGIRGKLLNMTLRTVVSYVIIGVLYTINLNSENTAREEIVQNGLALYNFQVADMMHDAIRADLYKTMLTNHNDKSTFKDISNEYEDHAKLFRSSLMKIPELGVEQKIKTLVSESETPLNDYINYTNELITWISTADSIDKAELDTKVAKFNDVFDRLAEKNEALSEVILSESEIVKEEAENTSRNSLIINITLILASISILVYMSLKLAKGILTSVEVTQKMILEISNGNLPNEEKANTDDELGEVVDRMNSLTNNLRNVKFFANQVGEGNFDTDVSVFNNSGELGTALSGMRDSLKQVAYEEKNRNWITTGIAQIAEILRQNNIDVNQFYDNIIRYIVKYVGANQGGLFLLNDDNVNDKHIELVACYAYDRKKFVEKRINTAEGLVGQCFLEKEMIFITELPQNYVSITSGLGEATPNCLVLMPLSVNEEINGVIEIASFEVLEGHKLELLKRLAENVAASISATKINAKTQKLLQQTQQQTEELKAQEEEMRQNFEELQATQEEINRKENSYLNKIDELEKKIQELNKG